MYLCVRPGANRAHPALCAHSKTVASFCMLAAEASTTTHGLDAPASGFAWRGVQDGMFASRRMYTSHGAPQVRRD